VSDLATGLMWVQVRGEKVSWADAMAGAKACRALGWMRFPPGRGEYRLLDVHGADAQRSDPKADDPAMFPHGRGPQGDVIRIDNFVRLRGGQFPIFCPKLTLLQHNKPRPNNILS
jgi:hypothetical protein